MKLKFDINVEEIVSQFKEFEMEVKQDLERAAANLAAISHAKVVEMAGQELHSSRKQFLDSLDVEEISPGIWVVSIDEKGLWIEEGLPENVDMKPALLKKGAKTSKSGTKYKSIPFDHTKPPSQLSPVSQRIVSEIKSALKREKIPFKKIERNADGSPRTGTLHKMNLGGSIPGKGNTGALQGLTIKQTMGSNGAINRSIVTFRTVSSGPASEGKWIHPGVNAKKFLDRALEYIDKVWEEQILPELISKWK